MVNILLTRAFHVSVLPDAPTNENPFHDEPDSVGLRAI